MFKLGSAQSQVEVQGSQSFNNHSVKKYPLYRAIGEYLNIYTSQKKSHYTRKNERTYFSNFYEYFSFLGVLFCDEVTPHHLERYKISLIARVKPATVNRQFNTLRNLYNILHKNDIILKNPFSLVKQLKEERPKIHLWSGRDFIRCRRNLDKRHADLLTFLWLSGARLTEAINLMWTDIDWEKKEITLRSQKNRHVSRIITLTIRIDKLFHTMAFKGGIYVFGEGSVFTSDVFGKEVKKRVLNFCQNRSLTLKGIRHTYCTRAHEKEIPDSSIQEMMGHASYRTTENYRHLSRKHLNKASEKM